MTTDLFLYRAFDGSACFEACSDYGREALEAVLGEHDPVWPDNVWRAHPADVGDTIAQFHDGYGDLLCRLETARGLTRDPVRMEQLR